MGLSLRFWVVRGWGFRGLGFTPHVGTSRENSGPFIPVLTRRGRFIGMGCIQGL